MTDTIAEIALRAHESQTQLAMFSEAYLYNTYLEIARYYPIRWGELLAARDWDFIHDAAGMIGQWDPDKKEFRNYWSPRYTGGATL